MKEDKNRHTRISNPGSGNAGVASYKNGSAPGKDSGKGKSGKNKLANAKDSGKNMKKHTAEAHPKSKESHPGTKSESTKQTASKGKSGAPKQGTPNKKSQKGKAALPMQATPKNKSGAPKQNAPKGKAIAQNQADAKNKAVSTRQTASKAKTKPAKQSAAQKSSKKLPGISQLSLPTLQKGKKHTEMQKAAPKEPFRITPLGGMKEIGKNITLIEYQDEILIIDCGMSFPEEGMYGIDVVIPDFSYLKENMEKVKGLIITHGHEDHIGGVPYLLQEIKVPIYASALATGLIKHKLEEKNLTADCHVISPGDIIHIGSFTVEAIHTTHSIADSFAFSIHCPAGHIVHTGDFKIDYTPLEGKHIDLARFAQLGDEGVDVLLCDSTNVLRTGFTPSERIVAESMNRIFEENDKRIIIATFSSNIHRIKHFMEASIEHGRKIAISGRSMENVMQIAKDLGYINLPETAFVDIRNISNIPDSALTIVTTGSQGEPMSALTRMANDNHRAVKLKKGDVVVFSSSPIPGNEKTITNVVNKLYEKQVKVFLSDFVDIHVSGHACQEELKLIHTLVRPKYFIPAHGEYRHLSVHANLAASLGMDRSNIFVMTNGDSLLIKDGRARVEKNYTQAEDVLVDGYGVGDVGNAVLRDRKQLSESGLIVVSVAVDSYSKELAAKPELITRGFIYVKENGPLIDDATDVVYETLERCKTKGTTDLAALKTAIRDDLKKYIFKKTRRSPVILPVILYV